MPHVKPDIESFARIKVVGVGGSGKNAVNHMIRSKVRGVEFIAVNTDAQDLHQSLAAKKIRIGKGVTKGLGTGMNPELGKQAAEETKDEIQETLKGADMVFIAGGMGGGTCTGASAIIAQAAKTHGALTIGVVTRPFAFEGAERGRGGGKNSGKRTFAASRSGGCFNCHSKRQTPFNNFQRHAVSFRLRDVR